MEIVHAKPQGNLKGAARLQTRKGFSISEMEKSSELKERLRFWREFDREWSLFPGTLVTGRMVREMSWSTEGWSRGNQRAPGASCQIR